MENLLSTFVTMIITGTFAVVAVMVVRLLLKPAPRIFSYLLWIAVLVRLTCPVLPQSEYFGVMFHTEFFGEKMDAFSEESTNLPTEKIVVTSEAKDGTDNLSVQERKETVEHSFVPAQPEVAAKESAGTDERESLILKVLFAIWVTMFAAILFYEMSSYIFFVRRIGRSEIRERTEDRKFTVKISEAVKTPFTSGLLHPVIYLPENMEADQEKLVIAHEKMHIRRLDYFIKPFAFFVCCIYWFNPFVWAAFYLMEQDMETSCDEAVLRRIGYDRKKDYANTLLCMAGGQKWKAGYPIAFGENSVKSRIRHTVKVKKASKWTIALSAVIVIAIVGLLSVNRVEAGENHGEESAISDTEGTATEEIAGSSEVLEQWRTPENDGVTEDHYYSEIPGTESDETVEIRYSYPVVYSSISDVFGTRIHPVTQEEKLHSGIDFAAEKRTPVTAAADGTVAGTGFDAEWGNYVILQHSNGDFTYYACLDEISSEQGNTVERGQRIATVGSTGISTGPHLHFAISRDGAYVDPMPLMETEETKNYRDGNR